MATCDIEQLIADGKCFGCLEPKQLAAVQLQMLCELKERIEALVAAIPAPAEVGPTHEDLVYAASLDIDLDGADYQTLPLGGNFDFNGTLNRPTVGLVKAVAVIIEADGSDRTLTFNASWTFMGTAPVDIAANKVGVLSITATGPAETDVICAYYVED